MANFASASSTTANFVRAVSGMAVTFAIMLFRPDVLGVLRRVDAARTAEPARPSTPDEDAA